MSYILYTGSMEVNKETGEPIKGKVKGHIVEGVLDGRPYEHKIWPNIGAVADVISTGNYTEKIIYHYSVPLQPGEKIRPFAW